MHIDWRTIYGYFGSVTNSLNCELVQLVTASKWPLQSTLWDMHKRCTSSDLFLNLYIPSPSQSFSNNFTHSPLPYPHPPFPSSTTCNPLQAKTLIWYDPITTSTQILHVLLFPPKASKIAPNTKSTRCSPLLKICLISNRQI